MVNWEKINEGIRVIKFLDEYFQLQKENEQFLEKIYETQKENMQLKKQCTFLDYIYDSYLEKSPCVFYDENGIELSESDLFDMFMQLDDDFLKLVCKQINFDYNPDQKSRCIGELLFYI
jgi:hypothetical protein